MAIIAACLTGDATQIFSNDNILLAKELAEK